MTRFARAEGSKSGNKRVIEEATTWQEMQAQSIALKKTKKKDSKKFKMETNVEKLDEVKENMLKVNAIENVENQSSLDKNKTLSVKKSKTKLKKLRKLERETDLVEGGNRKETSVRNKRSKIEKGMDYVVEDGKKYKILKNGQKKPWFDFQYQENEVMTRYKNFFVKTEMVQVLDDLRKSLEDEGADSKKIRTTLLHEERRAHNTLRVELLREQLKSVKKETGTLEKNKLKPEKKKEKQNVGQIYVNNKSDFVEKSLDVVDKRKKYKLEESELMTKFEDYWVLRNNVAKLKFVHEAKMKRIIEARTEPNESALLTPEEELVFRRSMKKDKRREHGILLKRIDQLGYDVCEDIGDADGGSEEKIKFMGYWIKKSAAVQLDELKDKLEKGGASQEEVFVALKFERRKEERHLKNDNKVHCFNCRQPGHMVSDCPNEKTVGYCFTCGSTEHMSRVCPEKNDEGPRYTHATCFVCGKIGHIASGCSDNPKGIYPYGGCCNECGSVRHLRANCPDLQVNSKEQTMDLYAQVLSSSGGLEDLGEDTTEKRDFGQQKSKRIIFDD